mgnify:CR=1 FL=1
MAGDGKNQVASSLLDLQPTAALEFFQIFPDPLNLGTNRISFHGGTLFGGVVTWQGLEYIPTAIESEGWETYSDKTLARPVIRISNKNYQITRLLQNYKDLTNAQVVRKKAFVKNLDDVNFDGGNPFGTADPEAEISSETWLIGQKLQENKIFVEFELNSPLDLESFDVNYRSIIAKYCYWQYRGEGCRYEGLPIERGDGELFTDPAGETVTPTYRHLATDPLIGGHGAAGFFNDPDAEYNINREYEKGDISILTNNKILIHPYKGKVTDPPVKLKTVYVCVSAHGGAGSGQYPEGNPTYWQKDGCTKKLGACRKRFNEIENISFYQNSTVATGFNYLSLSGTNVLENSAGFADDGADAGRAGMFYSNKAAITGVFTPSGQWTIAGWANTNTTQSEVAGVFSTTKNTGNNGHLYDFLNITLRSGASRPDEMKQYMGGFYRQNVEPDFVALNRPTPADAFPVLNDASVMDLGAVNGTWYFYAISNYGTASVGMPPYLSTADGTNLNAFVGNGPNLDKLAFHQRQGGAKLFKNEDDRSANGYVPSHFMLGAIPYNTGSGHASINGKLGPWMLWNRALDDEEIDFLYKDIENPPATPSPVNQIPRPFEECTGLRTGITGVLNGTGLIGWWDMTTGDPLGLGGIGGGYTGLVDKSENNHFLTGSGFYNTGQESFLELDNLQRVKNPSTPYPRFGGYPGTDGFGYGV